MTAVIRCVRVLVYEGDEVWMKGTMQRSIPQERPLELPNGGTVRELARFDPDQYAEPAEFAGAALEDWLITHPKQE